MLGEELRGGLLAHVRDAGDVVRRVAHERQEVLHALGATPHFSFTSSATEDPLVHGVPDDHVGVHELEEVFVAAEHTTTVVRPCLRAARSQVAMRSSASTPSCWNTGIA